MWWNMILRQVDTSINSCGLPSNLERSTSRPQVAGGKQAVFAATQLANSSQSSSIILPKPETRTTGSTCTLPLQWLRSVPRARSCVNVDPSPMFLCNSSSDLTFWCNRLFVEGGGVELGIAAYDVPFLFLEPAHAKYKRGSMGNDRWYWTVPHLSNDDLNSTTGCRQTAQ